MSVAQRVALEVVERHYRDSLALMDAHPLGRGRRDVRLAEVYLDLPVEPEREAPSDIEERRARVRDEEGGGEQAARLDRARRGELMPPDAPHVHDRMPVSRAVTSSGSVVLLGDPGCGKSTTLKHLLVEAVRSPRLPVLIPLATLAGRSVWAAMRECLEIEGLEELLLQCRAEGRLDLFFDGLDEIADLAVRRRAAHEIATLATGGNRVVVTSRYVGYDLASVPRLNHLVFVDLAPVEMESLVLRLANALDPATGAAETARMMAAIRDRPSLRALAANPFLLSRLVVLSRTFGPLPSARVSVLQQLVELLTLQWPALRSPGVPQPKNETLLERAAGVALAMLEDGVHGPIRRDRLERLVAAETAPLGSHGSATTTSFLASAQDAGLLIDRGNGTWGFVHRSIQEYLAARSLGRLGFDAWNVIHAHLHDPIWREPPSCSGPLSRLVTPPLRAT